MKPLQSDERKGFYTLDDLEALPENQRAELIDGEIFLMASPTPEHQDLVGELHAEIRDYLKGKKAGCRAYIAPLTVYLDAKQTNRHSVEPDIFVLCDPDKKKKDGIYGAPDWVIEVLSPSTASKDRLLKAYWYEVFGVKEYWIVDLFNAEVLVYLFSSGSRGKTYSFHDVITPSLYPDLNIKITDLLP